ncbi:hypothetical protein [Tenacibaculum maritimum]|uniref:hypothetical protein n=1 Tax=Tenacibaculum maritimum TaxID=107401 RepID=UPI0010A464A1|nr:hypothetical protein [Tenacibaculum maritimum]MCD9564253.1 hypothetical protein [Tenacibaculum maritimum]MCD9567080.1 hypothetical protein [Tenacibaculum maritimum]MCD9580288.1 hypothetical protein [Tenacibaculum maritimum]MCD9583072.1 hypothetical protein [Tenacibaculum maritimum]MCD9586201.1 hypothetical protein [Tenacibaculum maritimum]
MNRRDFSNLVNDFSKNYGTEKIINPSGQRIQLYDFGIQGSGSMRGYMGSNTFRFYWHSQGSNYKFTINVFDNIK